MDETRLVVPFERKTALLVDVHSGDDIEVLASQAMGQSAGPAEQVHDGPGHALEHWRLDGSVYPHFLLHH